MMPLLQKMQYLKELTGAEIFKAQLQLEQEMMDDLVRSLSELDLKNPNFSLEYAKLRGGIEALRSLHGVRKNLTNKQSA